MEVFQTDIRDANPNVCEVCVVCKRQSIDERSNGHFNDDDIQHIDSCYESDVCDTDL